MIRVTRRRRSDFGTERIRGWLEAGAELRVCGRLQLAYVRGRTLAFIITWPEAEALIDQPDTRICGGFRRYDYYRFLPASGDLDAKHREHLDNEVTANRSK